jgi:UDP-N-acetylmuramoyl-L-alanyl-D-glutamate--2,6-diaminopimelate ligase
MKLSAVLGALPAASVAGEGDPEITGIVADSRQVQPGALFVAIAGGSTDGHKFISAAVQRGAAAVAGEKERPPTLLVPYVRVADGRTALATLAAAWHGFPAHRLRVIGVTGTDGKTTTATMIHAILNAAGRRAGLVSTVAATIGEHQIDTGLHTTTPDALDVQAYLAEMVAASCSYAVLETTSHGLHQKRVDACDFDVAVVTNITHEHLDYHGSFENYREAKATLFRMLQTAARKPDMPKISVLNADDPSYSYLRPIPCDLQISYGLDTPADIYAADLRESALGTSFTAVTPAGSFPVQVCLPGRYNVANALAAISVAVGLGLPVEAMRHGLASVKHVVGRTDRIDEGQNFTAIVDFAHTPNALERVLTLARTMTTGRVIVVFGCAGLRDRGKRALMGEVAGRLADFTVITAEDPRTESLSQIMAEIAGGLQQAGRREGEGYVPIADRAVAIIFAVNLAGAGDLVIVTGKGHEQSMCFGTKEYPWSDHEALRAALRTQASAGRAEV